MSADSCHFARPGRCRGLFSLVLLLLLGVLPPALVAAPPPGGLPKGQKHERRHEIDQLEEAWRSAVVNADTAALGALLSDDFIAISANGMLETKEEVLAKLSGWRTHHTSLELSDRKVRFYGVTAVVTSLAQVTGANSQGETTGSYRYTRVYVRNAQGKWKIVSFEASRIRAPGEPK